MIEREPKTAVLDAEASSTALGNPRRIDMSRCAGKNVLDEIEAAEDRCENYAMLSRLFRSEIDASLLQDLKDSPVPDPIGNRDFDEGYRLLRGYLDAIEDIDAGKSSLAIDYCLAFIGYGSDPDREGENAGLNAAYPYESVYVSGSKTLAGSASAAVSAEYRCSGFAPTRERIYADDHLACELEYLQFLAAKELAALKGGDQGEVLALRRQELAFLEGHPLAWVTAFEAALGDFAETDFYRGLARMTRGWLEEDVRTLRDHADDKEADDGIAWA